MVTRVPPLPLGRPARWRLVAALAALVAMWGGLGIHLGPHSYAEDVLPAGDTVAACAHHVRTLHVEPPRFVHHRECPACLLKHTQLGALRALSPALCAPAPEGLTPAPPIATARRTPRDPSSRGPPLFSV